jgi:hypothetical protein
MSALLVRRPSWLWDSRAPFYNFISEHKRLNRQFGSIIVSTAAARSYLRLSSNEGRGVRQTLRVDKGGGRAGRAWVMFKRGSSPPEDQEETNRSPELFLNAVAEADAFVQQAAVVMYTAMFETYVLCWAMNYLLAHLESGARLSGAAASLAETFSDRPRHLNAPQALQTFPQIWSGLASVPHVFTNRKTGEPVEAVLDGGLNARDVVLFWRAYRNNVVHHGGLVTDSFVEQHTTVWDLLRSPYRGLVTMHVGSPLQFNDDVVRAALAVHYRAAHWLREPLVTLSGGRRGHVLAPAPPDENAVVGSDFVPPRLLLPGDHPPSMQAACNSAA